MRVSKTIISVSCVILILTQVAFAGSNKIHQWYFDYPNQSFIYSHIGDAFRVEYRVGVYPTLENSQLPCDTITIQCGDLQVKVEPGFQYRCKLPSDQKMTWFISPSDFKNGSRGIRQKIGRV